MLTGANKDAIAAQAIDFWDAHPEASRKQIVEAFEAAWFEKGLADALVTEASSYLNETLAVAGVA